MLEQQNCNGEQMTNDSLAESLVAYFDRHGSANERMRAYYMMGRTYFDLGELPRALETYFIARDCADTTATDCDYKVLSRIHAQSAVIFEQQLLPRNQLNELITAEYYAQKAKDSLQAIECYAQRAEAYDFLHEYDSVISIRERAYDLFLSIGKKDRAAQTLGSAIPSLIAKNDTLKTRKFIYLYETFSSLFNECGDIEEGREIYYSIKGRYYLSINEIDSAEYLFRKELRDGKDLNNQIAGNKGLQEVYAKRVNPDSIAKYASIGYELNDSAYSLSEIENIQRLSASYNYQHNKQLAQEKQQNAERAYWIIAFILTLMLALALTALYGFSLYKKKKEKELNSYLQDKRNLEEAKAELEALHSSEQQASEQQISTLNTEIQKLQQQVDENSHLFEKRLAKLENDIDNHRLIRELHLKAESNPYQTATAEDFQKLVKLMDELISTFYAALHKPTDSLRVVEYRVCMLIRFHFKSKEIWKLTETTDGYIANLKKRIYHKIFGVPGTAKDLESWIMNIR